MHTPIRTCISCRQRFAQSELIKITKSKSGIFSINAIADGRSSYVCANSQCINLCNKKKMLNKRFKCPVPDEIYEKLTNLQ